MSEMNERDAGRHRIDVGRQRQREQIAPDENSTSYCSSTLRTSGASRTIEPRNSGCEVGNERGVRHEFRIDRRPQELGECDQLGMGAALRDGIAGHDHGRLAPASSAAACSTAVAIPAHAGRNTRRHQ